MNLTVLPTMQPYPVYCLQAVYSEGQASIPLPGPFPGQVQR